MISGPGAPRAGSVLSGDPPVPLPLHLLVFSLSQINNKIKKENAVFKKKPIYVIVKILNINRNTTNK